MGSHRAALLSAPGVPLEIRQRQTPPVGPRQVLIRIQACGVNPVDWKVQDLGWCVTEWPSTIGCDGAGVVAAVGSEVTRVRVGDRVFLNGWMDDPNTCTFQEYALIADSLVGKIPDFMTIQDAAGISMASFTAFVGLFHETGAEVPLPPTARAHIPEDSPFDYGPLDSVPNESYQWPPDLSKFGWCITVLGGSSSVGQFMIQYARIAGFKKILTTASPPNHAFLRTLGATHLFDRSATASDIAAIASPSTTQACAVGTNQPYSNEYTPLVFDAIGSTQTTTMGVEILSLLTPEPLSRILVSPSVDDIPPITENVDYRGIYALVGALWDFSLPYFLVMEEWLARGEIVPNRIRVVGTVERANEALEMSRQGVSGVKLIMSIP